jgi:hypothetical protein
VWGRILQTSVLVHKQLQEGFVCYAQYAQGVARVVAQLNTQFGLAMCLLLADSLSHHLSMPSCEPAGDDAAHSGAVRAVGRGQRSKQQIQVGSSQHTSCTGQHVTFWALAHHSKAALV